MKCCRATVRYACEKVSGKNPESVVFEQFRGFTSVKTAKIPMGDINVRIAVCNGSAAACELIEGEKYVPLYCSYGMS